MRKERKATVQAAELEVLSALRPLYSSKEIFQIIKVKEKRNTFLRRVYYLCISHTRRVQKSEQYVNMQVSVIRFFSFWRIFSSRRPVSQDWRWPAVKFPIFLGETTVYFFPVVRCCIICLLHTIYANPHRVNTDATAHSHRCYWFQSFLSSFDSYEESHTFVLDRFTFLWTTQPLKPFWL